MSGAVSWLAVALGCGLAAVACSASASHARSMSRPPVVPEGLVRRRFLTLRQAQRALEKTWHAAWLKYVVATGHL